MKQDQFTMNLIQLDISKFSLNLKELCLSLKLLAISRIKTTIQVDVYAWGKDTIISTGIKILQIILRSSQTEF